MRSDIKWRSYYGNEFAHSLPVAASNLGNIGGSEVCAEAYCYTVEVFGHDLLRFLLLAGQASGKALAHELVRGIISHRGPIC